MLQLGNEHGGYAVEGRATFRLDGLQYAQGIKPLARQNHRAAVRHTGQVAQYHAEAMVERHRYA